MNNNYQNNILDAIQTLVDSAVSRAGYDKTIKAIISKCVDESKGKYVVRYQDSSFYAYSNDLDAVYRGGTSVYVLIPGNDMSQTKTILGSVDKLGSDYITLSDSAAAYQDIGASIIGENPIEVGISSYKSGGDSLVLYDRESNSNILNIDIEGAQIYFQNATYMEIGGTFRTTLTDEQKRKGNYGLVFDIDFKDGETITNQKYVIDINSMTGNPYTYNYGSEQNIVYQIDGEHFYRLNSITFECKNFPKSKIPYTSDIFVKDIILKALTPLTRDEIANNSLTFITKQGIYFNENDSADATRLIETEVKINKKVVPNTDLLRFYWFKEDSTVGITSPDYLPYGGPGWKCINQYNVIDETNNIRDYIVDEDTLTVVKNENPAKENEYKCVVIYNDAVQVERNIIIYNQASSYTVTIESDQGNYFKYNEGNPTLTCSVIPAGTYTYKWTETNSFNRTEVLTETSNTYSVQLGSIANFSKFTCSVFSNGNFLGKSNIVITNSWDPEDNSYAIVMENGDQIFKYNEKGIAPTNKSLEKPIVLKPLQFIIYDEFGHQVDDNKISAIDVSWYVPKEDTMIKITTTGITPIEEDGYLIYSGVKTLNFEIASVYNNKKMNNTIKLSARYNDRVLNTTSELEFIKEGEVGSNGTDFVCRIVPNVAANAQVPNYPIYTYNTTTSTGAMNYQLAANNKWFKVQLYKDGVQIYEDVASGTSEESKAVTVAWSMLTNKYSSTVSDTTSFNVNSSTGEFSYTNLSDINLDRAANIAKVTVTYDGATYYATMPIILVKVANASYKLDLENNTGFRYVMYTTDGLNPVYDSSNPFAVIAYNGETNITNVNNITFTYSTLGQTYNGTTWVDENNFIAKTHGASNPLAKNEADYRPVEKFDGLSTNNAIKCIVKENSSEIARIYLPIHFYLNRFGNAALNGWDGNHVEINTNGGFILAPQIGAGKKEQDNSYTGVFMGTVREAGSRDEEVGLYGYNHGERTIALDAEDGSARFGKQGAGQIVIDPGTPDYDGKGTARLYSSDYEPNYVRPSEMVPPQTKYLGGYSYWRKNGNNYTLLKVNEDYTIGSLIAGTDYVWANGSGLEIDLNDPHIRFGSGKFRVDSDGQVYATGFATVAEIEAGDYNIPGVENWKAIYATDSVQFATDSEHYPDIDTATASKSIVCQCSYKDSIVSTNDYSAVFATAAGVNIGTTTTIDNITGAITKSGNDTTLTFTVSKTGEITNATNTFYVKFVHTTSGLTILKAFNINLIILGADGAPGEQGPVGPAGQDGKDGKDGKDGTSVTVKGTYNSLADLKTAHPSGNTLGDGYIIGLDLFVFTNGAGGGGSLDGDWQDVGQFKGQDGQDGTDGKDAKRCFIVASTEVFKSTDGGATYAPASSTITPYTQAVTYSNWAYSTDGGVNYTTLDPNNLPTGITIDGTTHALTTTNNSQVFASVDTVVFKCHTNDNNVYDVLTITKIKDGAKGDKGEDATQYYTHIMYATDSQGSNISSNPTGRTYMGVRVDETEQASTTPSDYSWTKFVGEDGADGYSIWTYGSDPSASSGTYTFTRSSMVGPSGVDPQVGEFIYGPRYRYTIASVTSSTVTATIRTDLKGVTGTSATSVACGNEAQTISCNANGSVAAATTITIPFAGYIGNARAVCSVSYSTPLPSGMTYNQTESHNATTSADGALVFDVAANATLDNVSSGIITLTFSCNSLTFVKKFTWSKVIKGTDGGDAYTVVLSNESHTFPANTSTAIASSIIVNVYAYKGATAVTPTIREEDITGQITGKLTASVNGSAITINATNTLNVDGVLTIPVVVDGKTFNKKFSWSLAKAGTSPTAYNLIVSNATVVKKTDNSYDPTSVSFYVTSQIGDGIISPYTAGSYRIKKDNGNFGDWTSLSSTNSYNFSTNTPDSSVEIECAKEGSTESVHTAIGKYVITVVKDGIDGASSYTHIKYSANGGNAPMYDEPHSDSKYIGILIDNNSTASSTKGDYSWSRYTGKGITSVNEQYYLSTSSTTQTGGSWSNSQPEWESGKYIWVRDKIVWDEGNPTYTTPILANIYNDTFNELNEVEGTANAAYSLAQSAIITYTTTSDESTPGASAVWVDVLPAASNKYIWQRTEYKFLDSTKDYTTQPTCIYAPTVIKNELQYCLTSDGNWNGKDTRKIVKDWQSEPFAWSDDYYTSPSVGVITLLRFQYVRNKYVDINTYTVEGDEKIYATTYSDPILDQAWKMFGEKIAGEQVARRALESNIDNNIVNINSKDGITINNADSTCGIRLTSVGMQFLLNNEWTTVWNINGQLDANLITVKDLNADNILSGVLTLDSTKNNGRFIFKGPSSETARIDETGIKVTAKDSSYIYLKATAGDHEDSTSISVVTNTGEEYFSTESGTSTTIMKNTTVTNELKYGTLIKTLPVENRKGIVFIGV